MFSKSISLIEFIISEEKRSTDASGSLTLLLLHIEYAARIINSHLTRAGLVDVIGATGKKNVYAEEVQKLDDYSNSLLIDILGSSGVVANLASEELDKPIRANKNGKYDVFFDPLDGSSNIDVNGTVGTIFSIYQHTGYLLQKGEKQVAAGYIIYSASTMFVYTCGNGVNGFTLDPGIGSFLLSNKNIKIPQKGSIYSVNEANSLAWDGQTVSFINKLKGKYKSRYIGSMVADIHRTLLKGGVFLYPADIKYPTGKLRLMFEVNPLSFIISQAGGRAVSLGMDMLDIMPSSLEQTVPVVLGSPYEIKDYLAAISDKSGKK